MSETTTQVVPQEPKQEKPKKSEQSIMAGNYFAKDIVSDFSTVSFDKKLAVLQRTPKQFIKTRNVGNTQIPYVDYEYATKALNFIFNFNVSTEVLSTEFRQVKIGDKNAWEAEVGIKFSFVNSDGKTITKTVFSSHRGYDNPATTRGDIMKSAISKAYTVVARQFGIGADIKDQEEKAYEKAEEAPSQQQTPVQKKAWQTK